jgi:hypothetical protein
LSGWARSDLSKMGRGVFGLTTYQDNSELKVADSFRKKILKPLGLRKVGCRPSATATGRSSFALQSVCPWSKGAFYAEMPLFIVPIVHVTDIRSFSRLPASWKSGMMSSESSRTFFCQQIHRRCQDLGASCRITVETSCQALST